MVSNECGSSKEIVSMNTKKLTNTELAQELQKYVDMMSKVLIVGADQEQLYALARECVERVDQFDELENPILKTMVSMLSSPINGCEVGQANLKNLIEVRHCVVEVHRYHEQFKKRYVSKVVDRSSIYSKEHKKISELRNGDCYTFSSCADNVEFVTIDVLAGEPQRVYSDSDGDEVIRLYYDNGNSYIDAYANKEVTVLKTKV